MGVTVGFSLQQFSEVFKIRDAAGQPYLLIGGQAVNYWAERYLAVEPQLEKLQPFTSEGKYWLSEYGFRYSLQQTITFGLPAASCLATSIMCGEMSPPVY
jgi:hypothetical protein